MIIEKELVESGASRRGIFPPPIHYSIYIGPQCYTLSVCGPALDGEFPYWDVYDMFTARNETFDTEKKALDFVKKKMKEYALTEEFDN